MLRCAGLFLLTMLWSGPVPAQAPDESPAPPRSLEVTVHGKGHGRTLSRVEVRMGEGIYYTDPDGKVKLPAPATANPRVMFSRVQYERLIVDWQNLQARPEIYLWPGEPDDNEVIIKGSKRPEPSRKTITARETARITPGGDPVQVLQILPGVQTARFGQEAVIRGSGPNDSLYFVDDLKVLNIFHDVGNLSIIPDQIIDRVEFSSGGFGPRYGNATGGVVALRSTSEIPEHPMSEFRFSVPFFTALYHERPLDENSSLMLSVRHSITEWVVPAMIEQFSEDEGITAVPTFADAHIRYLVRTGDGHYKTTFITSKDGVVAAFPGEKFSDEDGIAEVEFADRFTVIGTERLLRLGDGWSLRTTPQLYRESQEFKLADNDGNMVLYRAAVPTEVEKRLGKGRYLYLGVDPEYWHVDVDINAIQPDSDDPFFDPETAERFSIDRTFKVHGLAAWAALDYRLGAFTLSPGLRVFRNNIFNETGADPRFGLRYEIDRSLVLKGSAGQYSQYPDMVEASEEFGNPDMKEEKANHFIIGVDGRISDRWEYDVQHFRKRIYRLIRSHGERRYEDEGTLLVNGWELFIRRFMTERTFGWLAYTWTSAKERNNDQVPFHSSPYDVAHTLNLATAYKLTASWEIAGRMRYATGRTYTEVTGSFYNPTIDSYQPTYNTEDPWSKNLPEYDLIDVFATWKTFRDTWLWGLRFGVQFISLRERVDGIEYNYDFSERRLVSNALPPIPFIEVRGQF